MESKVLTIGEIMMRLQPPACDRIRQAKSFDIAFGGGEANVAVCLSQLGTPSEFFTRLPNNEIGQACLGELRRFAVGTDKILFGGERMGVYYCEKGCSERPSRIIYDRKYSSFSAIDNGSIDYNSILDGVTWLHITGITPALSDNCLELTRKVLEQAKKVGVTVSCDLNYRAKLWSETKANEVMSDIMRYVDVVIANEEDAKKVFGIEAENTDIDSGKLDENGYASVCKQIESKYGVHTVAITMRESFSANKNGWSAILYRNNNLYYSKRYEINVLDRIGGGDSFVAGLIHSLISGSSEQDAIEYATACSCLKHSINGDFHIVSDSEVRQLLSNGGSGRVQR